MPEDRYSFHMPRKTKEKLRHYKKLVSNSLSAPALRAAENIPGEFLLQRIYQAYQTSEGQEAALVDKEETKILMPEQLGKLAIFVAEMSLEQFLRCLLATKLPTFFRGYRSEKNRQVLGKWRQEEISILSDITMVIPEVTIKDRRDKVTLVFTQGPLLVDTDFPPGVEENKSLPKVGDLARYQGLVNRRLFPALLAINAQAEYSQCTAHINCTGPGCAQLAGNFKEVVPEYLYKTVTTLLRERSGALNKIVRFDFDLYDKYKEKFKDANYDRMEFKVQKKRKRGETPLHNAQKVQTGSQFFYIVAADALALPFNDMNSDRKTTVEGMAGDCSNGQQILYHDHAPRQKWSNYFANHEGEIFLNVDGNTYVEGVPLSRSVSRSTELVAVIDSRQVEQPQSKPGTTGEASSVRVPLSQPAVSRWGCGIWAGFFIANVLPGFVLVALGIFLTVTGFSAFVGVPMVIGGGALCSIGALLGVKAVDVMSEEIGHLENKKVSLGLKNEGTSERAIKQPVDGLSTPANLLSRLGVSPTVPVPMKTPAVPSPIPQDKAENHEVTSEVYKSCFSGMRC